MPWIKMLRCLALALGYDIASEAKLAADESRGEVPRGEALPNNGRVVEGPPKRTFCVSQ
jgi:hypothetical protein